MGTHPPEVSAAWPLLDVAIRTPRLELRLPTEAEFMRLIAGADESIYAQTGFMPFSVDRTNKPTESMKW